MKALISRGNPFIDVMLWVWFALRVLTVAYLGYEQFKAKPGQNERSLSIKTMRWGWALIALSTNKLLASESSERTRKAF